jgi:hypothetical protein
MFKTLILAATAATLIAPFARAETPEPPYRWTCKVDGYYALKVTPETLAHTLAETWADGPLTITIKPRSEARQQTLRNTGGGDNIGEAGHWLSTSYAVQVKGTDPVLFGTHDDGDTDDSAVRFDYPHVANPAPYQHRDLLSTEVIYWNVNGPKRLLLHRADKDWTFMVYMGDLHTDADARHLNITAPPINREKYTFDAEAEVTLLTGPCVQES